MFSFWGGKTPLSKKRRQQKAHRIHEFSAKALRAAAVEGALGLELGEGGSCRGRSDRVDVDVGGDGNGRRRGGERDRGSLRCFCLFFGGRSVCCAPAVGHFSSPAAEKTAAGGFKRRRGGESTDDFETWRMSPKGVLRTIF
jgi:hypothetical protein